MADLFLHSEFFGFAVTILFFALARILQEKTRTALLNPIIVSAVAIILVLCLCKIDFSIYERGAKYISIFLTPATICYAVPLYKQVKVLKENALALIVGILSGCASSAASIIGAKVLFGVSSEIYTSMLPKSVTTAIGMAISEKIGGIPSVTVGAIMITGITGAIIAPYVCRAFKIKDPVAVGIAIGSSSHAIGTTKAFEMGEIEGAMSSLAIVITGIITVVIVPVINFF